MMISNISLHRPRSAEAKSHWIVSSRKAPFSVAVFLVKDRALGLISVATATA